MSWLSRFVNVLRRKNLERDLEDELQFHLDARIDELTSRGMPAEQAAEYARRRFGDTLRLRESSRDIKLIPRLDSILLDVVFGLRAWRRNKVVTAAAVVSLSLAIGACAAAFSLIDALILRSLPVDDPSTLVHLGVRAPGDARDGMSFNYPLFEQLRDASRAQVRLFGLSDQSRRDASFDDAAQPEKVYGQWISGDAFAILGVRPALGRLIMPSDDVTPGRHPVAVLSHDFWTRRFDRSPSVLGRWVTIREKSLQIIGVAEARFTGVEPGIMTDLWAPNMMWDARVIADASTRWFRIWGRMQPDVDTEQARSVLQTVFTGFQRAQARSRPPDEPPDSLARYLNTSIHVRPSASGYSWVRQEFARALWILAGVALLVLLVACANVASLLVARASSREREIALRISIGAGRGRLIQQMLIESALLSAAAGVIGAVVAVVIAPGIVSMLSTSRSVVRLDLHWDWRIALFLGTAGLLVTFLFGLAPALRASAVTPYDALKSGNLKEAPRVGLFRPLVAAQTAFAFVVLFVAGMCLASFQKLVRIDLGFDPENIAIVRVQAGEPGSDAAAPLALWEQLQRHLERTPGIESVSVSRWGLFEGPGRNKSVRVPGRAVDSYMPWYLDVSPGFLRTMRIRLVEGRDLEWRDGVPETPSAVLVNEGFARRYFPGESAVGKRFFRIDGDVLVPQDIVGIAGDAKYTDLREAAPPTVYELLRPFPMAVLQVRTPLDGAVAALLREELPRVHPALRSVEMTLQSTLVGNHLVRDRALALLSGFFSIVVMVLVAVGLYGVLTFGVLRRMREIGIRMALGARPLRVVALVLSEIGWVTAIGLAIGAAGGIATARLVTGLLHEVTPSDPWSLATPLICLVTACLLAALLPALRATRVDPVTALRCD
jgi:putative ABC transport system permease protein